MTKYKVGDVIWWPGVFDPYYIRGVDDKFYNLVYQLNGGFGIINMYILYTDIDWTLYTDSMVEE